MYPWADCTRIIQVAYGFKNTADGFDWSEAPVIFTGFVSFPLPGRNDGCASWLVSVREGSFCIYFHASLFVQLQILGMFFFCYLFSSTRELFFKQFLYYIFLRFSPPIHQNAHLASNGSTNSVGSFSRFQTHARTRGRCCTSTTLFSRIRERIFPRGFFFFLNNRSYTRCDTSSRR